MLNKKQNFKKVFIHEFKNTYNSNIKVTDFIPQEELSTTKKVSISWKYATVFTIFLLIISVGLLGVGVFNTNDDEFIDEKFEKGSFEEYKDNLSEEALTTIYSICDSGIDGNTVYYVDITEDITLYIYKGINEGDFVNNGIEEETIYEKHFFYVFEIKDETKNVDLLINGIVIDIDKDNNFGLLGSMKEETKTNIKFDIVYKNKVKEYVFTE